MYSYLRTLARNSFLSFISAFVHPVKGIHILNGHMVSRTMPEGHIFPRQLNQLKKHCTFIKIEEAVRLIEQKREVDDILVAFTFDDGFKECADLIAPALEAVGTNALFFVNPNFVEGDTDYIRNFTENIVMTPGKLPMDWETLRKLQDRGHIIGAHTLDHYMINDDDREELEYQIGHCKTVLESRLHKPCEYFAFPFGRLEHANPASIEIATHYYKHIFSQSDYKHYFSFGGKVINRRHFEPFWPVSHVKYFISHHKTYESTSSN